MSGWHAANAGWLARARQNWAPRAPEPLLVRAWLASPVACDGYDPLTLEGVLQSVVCLRETGVDPGDVYSECPLREPLANTDIQIPIVDTVAGVVPIAHASVGWFSPDALATKRQGWKRADAESYARPIVKLSEAGTKTQMVLKATVTAQHVDFYVEGDRALLSELLRDASHLGAGRAGGLGVVQGWEVTPVPVSWWWFGPGGRLMRSLPVEMIATDERAGDYDAREATLRAPYWHHQTRTICGVPVQRFGEPIGQAVGEFFITGHAVRRFKERVPGKARLSYEEALAELIQTMKRSHFVKTQDNGLDLWRGPRPHRLRLKVARAPQGLPQLVTVLRGCDDGWQR